jgi:hypothetical protein
LWRDLYGARMSFARSVDRTSLDQELSNPKPSR